MLIKQSAETAHIIVDTLNTEALAHVQIAYSGVIENLAELPGAFRESTLALKVGELFYSEQTVFPYNELGTSGIFMRKLSFGDFW